MIGYVTLGTNDLERAAGFYDELLAELGARRYLETESFIAWTVAPGRPALSLNKPFDGNVATVGNGVMVAFTVDSPQKVDAIYKKAIDLGAQDEGPPGPRGKGGFYAAYFRDLDGNKMNVYFMGPRMSAVLDWVKERSRRQQG